MKPSRDQIKAEAQMRIDTVLAALGIHGQQRKGYILLCNPIRGERHPSMQIWTRPGVEGAWKDYGAGLKGDIFDLVAYWHGWDNEPDRGFARAAAWLADLLGLGSTAHGRPNAAARKRRAEEQRRAAEQRARRDALDLWLSAYERLAGTPVETYLRTRGIDLARLKQPPRAIRYLARHRHAESGVQLPCMIAVMQDGSGRPAAVHRTWLAPDGSGKADVVPARKIWPSYSGAIIPIARGESGLSVKEAIAAGVQDTLVLAEGIEDGLSIAVAEPSVRVWAVGSIGNLARVPVPPCAAEILVWADNDWGKPQASAQLERGLTHLRQFGRPVVVVRSPVGKDANDLLRGGT